MLCLMRTGKAMVKEASIIAWTLNKQISQENGVLFRKPKLENVARKGLSGEILIAWRMHHILR